MFDLRTFVFFIAAIVPPRNLPHPACSSAFDQEHVHWLPEGGFEQRWRQHRTLAYETEFPSMRLVVYNTGCVLIVCMASLSLTNRFETYMGMWMARALKSANPDRVHVCRHSPTKVHTHMLTSLCSHRGSSWSGHASELGCHHLRTVSPEEWTHVKEARTPWSTRLPLPSSHSVRDWIRTSIHATAHLSANNQELLNIELEPRQSSMLFKLNQGMD